jgi:hypothetical protein
MTDWCQILRRCICGGMCALAVYAPMKESFSKPSTQQRGAEGFGQPLVTLSKDKTHQEYDAFVKIAIRPTIVTSTGMLHRESQFTYVTSFGGRREVILAAYPGQVSG